MLIDKIDVNNARQVQPYVIYRRINMITGKNPLFFPIPYGYWYYIHRIYSQWPELDTAGLVFAPEISFENPENSRHIVHENNPVPIRLVTSPAEHNTQINAAGLLTAMPPLKTVDIDYVLPQRDNIQIYVSGQNATPFPAWIDIMMLGYLVPDVRLPHWRGTNG